jgi:heme-binding NEAT domain protein
MKLFTNKFTTKLSKLFALALITILTLSTSSAFADSNIKDGRYTLTNDTKYLDNNEVGDSMSRSYTDKNMTLEKKDGKIYYTVGFSGAQYMENHRIYVNGSSVSIQKVAQNTSAGTLKLKFKVNKPSDTILIKFYVDPMGRDVEYQLIPNLNSLSLVESYEEAKTDSKTESTNNSKNESKTESTSTSKTETKSESTSTQKEETKVESTTTSKEETKVEEKVDSTSEEKEETETKTEETEEVSEETESVETSVKESSQNNTSMIVIISVIVILAAIIIFVLFKRKK